LSDAADDTGAKRPRGGCPHCGAKLPVGFTDLLPRKGRGGTVRYQCEACGGWARLGSTPQIMAVLGFVLGLAGGAVAAATVASDSQQSTVIVLALAVAGALLLSFVAGHAFLRFDPDGDPPSRFAWKRDKRRRK
jgi:hypothetical protein